MANVSIPKLDIEHSLTSKTVVQLTFTHTQTHIHTHAHTHTHTKTNTQTHTRTHTHAHKHTAEHLFLFQRWGCLVCWRKCKIVDWEAVRRRYADGKTASSSHINPSSCIHYDRLTHWAEPGKCLGRFVSFMDSLSLAQVDFCMGKTTLWHFSLFL